MLVTFFQTMFGFINNLMSLQYNVMGISFNLWGLLLGSVLISCIYKILFQYIN